MTENKVSLMTKKLSKTSDVILYKTDSNQDQRGRANNYLSKAASNFVNQ